MNPEDEHISGIIKIFGSFVTSSHIVIFGYGESHFYAPFKTYSGSSEKTAGLLTLFDLNGKHVVTYTFKDTALYDAFILDACPGESATKYIDILFL